MRALSAASESGFQHRCVQNGVQVHLDGMTRTVLFYWPAVVRVNAHPGESHWRHPSLVVIRPAPWCFAIAVVVS